MPPRGYYWFDTPDGQDLLKKTNFAAKLGFGTGVSVAIFDHCMFAQPNLKGYAFRAAAFVVPAVGSCTAFALTSQMLCRHVPQIPQEFSYMIGGLAAGCIFGAATRNPFVGSVSGIYLGVMAYFARDIHNWTNIPTVLGELPRHPLINDDEFLAIDYRHSPKLSNPPPKARPAEAPSTFHPVSTF